jgi:hypothetical protein
MIKKVTKVIFEGEGIEGVEELTGGMPLSVGEIVTIHKNGSDNRFEVVKKGFDIYLDEADPIVDLVYTLRKQA